MRLSVRPRLRENPECKESPPANRPVSVKSLQGTTVSNTHIHKPHSKQRQTRHRRSLKLRMQFFQTPKITTVHQREEFHTQLRL